MGDSLRLDVETFDGASIFLSTQVCLTVPSDSVRWQTRFPESHTDHSVIKRVIEARKEAACVGAWVASALPMTSDGFAVRVSASSWRIVNTIRHRDGQDHQQTAIYLLYLRRKAQLRQSYTRGRSPGRSHIARSSLLATEKQNVGGADACCLIANRRPPIIRCSLV